VLVDLRGPAGSAAGVVLLLGTLLGTAGCGDLLGREILGPPPEFLQACRDVRAVVAQGTTLSESTVDKPQEFTGELRRLSADLRALAGGIKDEPLREAVVDLASSYQTTADLTAQSRGPNAPNAADVRRSAARVDEICNSK
jgi:hypothetical protein